MAGMEEESPLNITESWLPSDDGTRLFVRHWGAAGREGAAPRAAVQIIHGMAEHSLRYDRVARRLAGMGMEVYAADQRGHGRTADLSVNDPGKGGLLGHTADRNGFFRAASDADIINDAIQAAHPGLPLYLLGHSWGSFVAQAYIALHSERLAGCILSGTKGPGDPKVVFSAPLLACIAALKGCRRTSSLVYALADGAFNKPFRPNRTPADWLSRDEGEVDAFMADPLSGQRCSSGFYRDMIGGLREIHRSGFMARIRRDLPVYIFCGSADPVGDMGAGPAALADAYRAMGIRDLEFVIYPDARHETLNETNREEVTENLLSWLEKHIGSGASGSNSP